MDPAKKKLAESLEVIEIHYYEWMESQGLKDTILTRVLYYDTAKMTLEELPLEDPADQAAVIRELERLSKDAQALFKLEFMTPFQE